MYPARRARRERPPEPGEHRYNTRRNARAAAEAAVNNANQIQAAALNLPRPQQHIDPVYGPENIFDSIYYNPRNPGSFSGVSAFQRQLKGIKTQSETKEWLNS